MSAPGVSVFSGKCDGARVEKGRVRCKAPLGRVEIQGVFDVALIDVYQAPVRKAGPNVQSTIDLFREENVKDL